MSGFGCVVGPQEYNTEPVSQLDWDCKAQADGSRERAERMCDQDPAWSRVGTRDAVVDGWRRCVPNKVGRLFGLPSMVRGSPCPRGATEHCPFYTGHAHRRNRSSWRGLWGLVQHPPEWTEG
jgi:hypothetical protein